MTPATIITNTTRDPTKTLLLKDELTTGSVGAGKETDTSLFTTTNILLGVGILAILGMLILLTIRRKK